MTESTGVGQAAGHGRDASVTDDFQLAGVPDAFQRLWTPHRMAYVKGGAGQLDHPDACPFCVGPSRGDEESLIVHRGRLCYVVLNLYPYNPGHVLINPYRHVSYYTELTVEETAEFSALTQTAMEVIQKVSNPGGFNIGMNQGKVGGAGIAAHLHQHVVPRWGGDGNFLPVIAQTKAITQTLGETRELLAAAWPQGGSGTVEVG
ncbi:MULTISPECIES: HIT domain-containing protein [Arthrobacter]|uniref:HIT domain-containing protein n=2 Tax=Arthrobacter TaxID=1663 RepID=A0ABU9KGS6_9MICC|nr:HIT domain-containing protein [Arthrobacter sp. YJM1]MDP5226084.1 HIT domain-containing protein [Arthrobacter sp. YJM1]